MVVSGEQQAAEVHDGRQQRAARRCLAWCVHAYTALGLVAAAVMAVLIVHGGPRAFRGVFLLMLAATLVDATDGVLARAARVKEVLPRFDGRQLDYLIDFLNYAALPLFLLWRAQIIPDGQELYLLAPLLAGAYWFCQVDAKTADGYFLGFPSHWNVVAFYLYVLHFHVAPLPAWLSIGLLLALSLFTLVPSRYLYMTQGGRLNLLSNGLAAIWVTLLLWIVFRLPTGAPPATASGDAGLRAMILISLLFPAYYLGVSWIISWRCWRAGKANEAKGGMEP